MFGPKDSLSELNNAIADSENEILAPYLHGPFADLTHPVLQTKAGRLLHRGTKFISDDLLNLASLCHRLELTRKQANSENSDDAFWYSFVPLDIENFLFQFRALLDHIPPLLSPFANKPGQLPSDSYEDFLNFAASHPRRFSSLFDNDLEKLITQSAWVKDIRHLRVEILHNGSAATAFDPKVDGILFQIRLENYQRAYRPPVDLEALVSINENHVLRFDSFAAIYFGRLLTLLNRIAQWIYAQPMNFEKSRNTVHMHYIGYGTLRSWARSTLDRMELA